MHAVRGRTERVRRWAIAALLVTSSVLVPAASSHAANSLPLSDSVVTNPPMNDQPVLLGQGRMAASGTVEAVLYRGRFSWQPFAEFRDSSSGAMTNVALPVPQLVSREWANVFYALDGLNHLWVFAGSGPVVARDYQLSGSPLPITATLKTTTSFGDTDSVAGGVTRLASGGLVGVWHQQGALGAQGLGIAYRSAGNAWSTTYPLQFMPTASSVQAVAQHPSDGSIWVLNDPDAWHAIGAAHLTEGVNGLTVDWTNASYIDVGKYGANGPDPENPDLEAAADPATATIAVAYESDTRQIFSTSPVVTGSYPTIARIGADASVSFLQLPVYVERVSALGLAVRPGETWLAYRPVNPSTLTFDQLTVSRFAGGAWSGPTTVGTLADSYGRIGYGPGLVDFAADLADGQLHEITAGFTAPAGSTTTTTVPSTTTTVASSGGCKARKCR